MTIYYICSVVYSCEGVIVKDREVKPLLLSYKSKQTRYMPYEIQYMSE